MYFSRQNMAHIKKVRICVNQHLLKTCNEKDHQRNKNQSRMCGKGDRNGLNIERQIT